MPKKTQCGLCNTCKWWQEDAYTWMIDDRLIHPTDPDTCEEMPTEFDVRACTSPKLPFYERPIERDWATVCDGSEYRASLYTGPDFGCVNHEDIPESQNLQCL